MFRDNHNHWVSRVEESDSPRTSLLSLNDGSCGLDAAQRRVTRSMGTVLDLPNVQPNVLEYERR